jgi:hypothetical protein
MQPGPFQALAARRLGFPKRSDVRSDLRANRPAWFKREGFMGERSATGEGCLNFVGADLHRAID